MSPSHQIDLLIHSFFQHQHHPRPDRQSTGQEHPENIAPARPLNLPPTTLVLSQPGLIIPPPFHLVICCCHFVDDTPTRVTATTFRPLPITHTLPYPRRQHTRSLASREQHDAARTFDIITPPFDAPRLHPDWIQPAIQSRLKHDSDHRLSVTSVDIDPPPPPGWSAALPRHLHPHPHHRLVPTSIPRFACLGRKL